MDQPRLRVGRAERSGTDLSSQANSAEPTYRWFAPDACSASGPLMRRGWIRPIGGGDSHRGPPRDAGSIHTLLISELPVRRPIDRTCRRVAIIDDSDELMTVLRELLIDDGNRVCTYSFPPPVEHFLQEPPDIIVLDIVFEHVPIGLRYRSMIRDCPSLSGIPIVLCTAARELVELEVEPLCDPLTTVLLKPFDIEDLGTIIADFSSR